MEEVTKEIALSLSMKTIFITTFAAIITISIAVIIKPTILIARDFIAWKLIERFYANPVEEGNIEKLFRLKIRLQTQFKESVDYHIYDDELVEAFIGDERTDPQYVFIYQRTKKAIGIEIIQLQEKIERKSKRLSFVLQHLGMKDIKNPLEELEIKYEEHYRMNTPRNIKIDYDWSEDDAIKEIKKHL
ncbi:MAG: hypothetical protein ACQEUY_11685 [Pseudomonadota bacterium]